MARSLHSTVAKLRGDPDALIALVLAQAETIERLRSENALLRAQVEQLQARIEASERAAKRPAAPHRIADKRRKKQPKRPGRKKGHEPARRRPPDHIDETIEVPLCGCPHCGGGVEDVRVIEQFITEIPPVRPHVVRLLTYRGRCARCGERVCSRHPLQRNQAVGAAGVQIGPRALALAVSLQQDYGLSTRKTCQVMERLLGLRLSPGGLVQAAHRLAERLQPQFDALRRYLRRSSVVHVDETGWWIRGPSWLWVFTNAAGTLYRITAKRERAVVHDMLGADFAGVLVSDCLNIYDGATPLQHKCYAHHLKAISQGQEVFEAVHGRVSEYLGALRAVLLAAMGLKRVKPEVSPGRWAAWRAALERRADVLLARVGSQEAGLDGVEARVGRRLLKQRAHLFVFLDHEGVEATNNLAERQLRPAVITRKLSCGNRSERGARTFEVLRSLTATCRQHERSFIEFVQQAIAGTPQPLIVR